jgi:hypothetical protein
VYSKKKKTWPWDDDQKRPTTSTHRRNSYYVHGVPCKAAQAETVVPPRRSVYKFPCPYNTVDRTRAAVNLYQFSRTIIYTVDDDFRNPFSLCARAGGVGRCTHRRPSKTFSWMKRVCATPENRIIILYKYTTGTARRAASNSDVLCFTDRSTGIHFIPVS